MDGSGGYCRQMERAMDRAVSKGLMSPVEFHCRKADMMETLASGLDDGTTRTSSKTLSSACHMFDALLHRPLTAVSCVCVCV